MPSAVGENVYIFSSKRLISIDPSVDGDLTCSYDSSGDLHATHSDANYLMFHSFYFSSIGPGRAISNSKSARRA
jgi:hypothetical protein